MKKLFKKYEYKIHDALYTITLDKMLKSNGDIMVLSLYDEKRYLDRINNGNYFNAINCYLLSAVIKNDWVPNQLYLAPIEIWEIYISLAHKLIKWENFI